MDNSTSRPVVAEIVRNRTERRRGSTLSRVRRFVMMCVVYSDLDTISIMILSFQAAMIFALMLLQERLVVGPPPFLDGLVLRLPAFMWCVCIAVGMAWQIKGWRRNNCHERRNGAAVSVVIIYLLCGPLFVKGPGLAAGVFLMNFWQLVAVGRLIVLCEDEDNQQ